jgi:hypothetical protein
MFRLPGIERRINKKQTAYVEEGVSITPMPLTMDEPVTITYDGLLAQSGAQKVLLHLGAGNSNEWTNVHDLEMKKESNRWTTEFVPSDSRLNFCFHDGADNWDNNYNLNWSLTIHNGK